LIDLCSSFKELSLPLEGCRDPDTFYFSKGNALEIEFVTRRKDELTLVEAKANDGNAKSLRMALKGLGFVEDFFRSLLG